MLPPATQLGDIPLLERNELLLNELRAGTFDFIDFGSHTGNSMRRAKHIGGRRGLGIEMDPRKCLALYEKGYYVLNDNLMNLPELPPSVDFAVCSHILEHLPNEHHIYLAIERLATLCRKFILIEQPDFSAERYLFYKGLKMAHYTMAGHNCHINTRDLVAMLWSMNLGNFVLGKKLPIPDSDHPWIHRADAPEPVWLWEEGKSLPKPSMKLDHDLHRDIVLVISTSPTFDPETMIERAGIEKVALRSWQALL